MTGFINVNKAEGVSSAAEVAKIKRLLKTPCGHMGTLDPMATGVLPVAVGNAARLFDYFLEKRKTYVATFRFGVESDTLDTTGNVRENAGLVPQYDEVLRVLPFFTGEIMQVPPKYSAINVGGRRGYALAREGVAFEPTPKKVKIYSLKLLDKPCLDKPCGNNFRFEIECGGGTYVRSLGRDIAARLNTCAVMSALVRTRSGIFGIENSVPTQSLTAENVNNYIIPTENVLPYDVIQVDGDDAKKLFNGVAVNCAYPDGIYKIYKDGLFYGLAQASQYVLKVIKKLC